MNGAANIRLMETRMEIDQKILEEAGRVICVAANRPKNGDAIYEPVFNVADPIQMAQAAIETYERLKPSPWRPIEEEMPDGIYLVSYPKYRYKEDTEMESHPFEHETFMVKISNNVWNEPPEIYEAGAYLADDFVYGEPTHFMPIPKMTGGE
jgi:hypothetical protein